MAKFELRRLASYDDQALLAELRRVAALITTPWITQEEFDRHSKASSSVIRRRFGNWEKALEKAGFADRYSGRATALRKRHVYSDEDLIAQLKAIANKTGSDPLTVQRFNEHSILVNAETIRRRFGSWWAVLEKAGLKIANLGRRYSDDDYFENLLTVWTHYGRQPSYSEMDRPPSRISPGAYEHKWGTWRRALLAFIEKANKGVDEQAAIESLPEAGNSRSGSRTTQRRTTPKRSAAESPRSISLGLRYDVFRRDRF